MRWSMMADPTASSAGGEQETESSPFPFEVLPIVLKKLPLKDLVRAEAVCKTFQAACTPQFWANATLDLSSWQRDKESTIRDTNVKSLIAKANGILRRNIRVINLARCKFLTAEALCLIEESVDPRASPPRLINVTSCPRLESITFVKILLGLEKKLIAKWDNKKTKLRLMSSIFDDSIEYLKDFSTTFRERGEEYNFKCKYGRCLCTFDEIEFCSGCEVSVCECSEQTCRGCEALLCEDCDCNDCNDQPESEEEPGLFLRDQSDLDDSDYWDDI